MKLSFLFRWRYAVIAMTALLAGTGCIKIDSTLTINRDGSGTMRAMYGMPTFFVKQLETTRHWTQSLDWSAGHPTNAALPDLDVPMIFDETVLNGKFEAMASQGVVLAAPIRTRDQGGWKYVDFTMKFSRLEDLFRLSFFEDCGVLYTQAGEDTGKLVLTLPPVGKVEASPDSLAKLTPFLNGLRVVVRIDCPGDIRNSSSLMSDVRRATWEWDFDKDIHVMDRLSAESIVVVFNANGVRIRDFEKPAGRSRFTLK